MCEAFSRDGVSDARGFFIRRVLGGFVWLAYLYGWDIVYGFEEVKCVIL